MAREAKIERTTSETSITLRLIIDGKSDAQLITEIPFFDHMLTLFARHGLFDIEVAEIVLPRPP